MILRSLGKPLLHDSDLPPRAAYDVFLASQKSVRPPFLAIPQSSHAHLAGELATVLLPEVFGPLPTEVVETIRQHDYGWITNDLAQLQARPAEEVRSFPALSPEKAVPAWEASVHLAETASLLQGVLTNRHFCLLSEDDNPLHREFRAKTQARRKPIENALTYRHEDLEQWTAALGICDLMSLYLCSGSHEPAEFPFCHPADASARDRVDSTVLTWDRDRPRFTKLLFREGARVLQSIPAYEFGRTATCLEWVF